MLCLQDQNLVLVVDDDPGMLKGIQRLLRQHAYEAIPFSSAQAFKTHIDFEKAVCVILAGCIAFLEKPFSAQSLIEPLKKATAGRS